MIDAGTIVRDEALIDELAITPDGAAVVYGRRTVEDGRHVRNLWLVPWAGGRTRRLTRGRHLDHAPGVSPDGTVVAFLSDRGGAADQVWVVGVSGGAPRQVSHLAGGVTAFAWRADGAELAVTAHARVAGPAPVSRVIERLDWRDEDAYGRMDRPTHVVLVALDGTACQVTDGEWFAYAPGYLPDGRVAFLADRRPDGDVSPHRVLTAVTTDRRLFALVVPAGMPTAWAVRRDGSLVIVAHGQPDAPDDDPAQVAIDGVLVPGQGDRFVTLLSSDGAAAVIADGGREIVVRVSPSGVRCVLGVEHAASIDAVAAAGEHVAVVATLGSGFAEVYALEPAGQPRVLTSHGAAWFRRLPQPLVEEVLVPGPEGGVHTWILSPPDAAALPLPTVIALHGGPVWAWGPAPELGIQLLVQAGYRVALPNVHGSYGFGREHVAGLVGRWGEPDSADVHAVCDHLVANGLTDPARIGLFGRSYGGFLVNWLLGTSDRFAAAVSECGVVNQVSAFANSDCGHTYNPAAGLGEPNTPDGVARLWRQSPLRHVAQVRAPLLLLQGEDDLRCPPADAEQLFVALRWLRRDVVYVLYPGCGHDYHRTARPDRRSDRHERLVGWFARHMPVP